MNQHPATSFATLRKAVPEAWEWAIADYLHAITAAGHREATRALRRHQLRNMARGPRLRARRGHRRAIGRMVWAPEAPES